MRIAILLAILLLNACSRPPEWQGWVYPDGDNLLVSRQIGTFVSLAECRRAAQSYVGDLPDPDAADYECGHRCEPSGYGGNICEQTSR